MTITVTPLPAAAPPRVRIDANVDVAGASFTELTVSRDGRLIREQPFVGSSVTVAFDYEAPFGVPVEYTVAGAYLPPATPDWSEAWASLASWTGDTGSFTVSSGKARSAVAGAKIVRNATGVIQRVSVTDPSFVRVELLDASNAVVASIQVGSSVVVAGTGTASATGGGSFTATLSGGIVAATATDSSWSTSQPYTGTPTKVRVVSLGVSYPPGQAFDALGRPEAIARDGAGNFYVADTLNNRIRKFNPDGTPALSIPIVGKPLGVAVDGSGNIYVADVTNSLVRKFNPAGNQTLQFSTTGRPESVALDGSGNIYVGEYTNNLIRKYNASGSQTLSFSTTGSPAGVTVDSSGNIYVADDDNEVIRKFNASGTQTLSFSAIGDPRGVALDAAGNIYVADGDPGTSLVRKFTAAGAQTTTFSTTGQPDGIAVDSAGNVHIVDYTNYQVRSFVSTTPSVGAIVETPVILAQKYTETALIVLSVADAWLIHPTFPTLSRSIDPGQHAFRDDGINVDATTKTSTTRAARSTRHDLLGRRRAVVITSGPRAAPEWELRLRTRRLIDRDAVDSLVDDQTPLLLRSPRTWPWDLPDGWYSIGDYSEDRPRAARLDAADRVLTLPMVPVESPIVRRAAVWTYGTDLLKHPTYAAARAALPTYLARLTGEVR